MKLNAIGKICVGLMLVVALIGLSDWQEARQNQQEVDRAERQKEMLARSRELWPDALLEKALPAIRAEKGVLSATWERQQYEQRILPVLVATMKNDGSDRTGFAEYLCQVLPDFGITGTRVDIQDADNQPATMGFTLCPK